MVTVLLFFSDPNILNSSARFSSASFFCICTSLRRVALRFLTTAVSRSASLVPCCAIFARRLPPPLRRCPKGSAFLTDFRFFLRASQLSLDLSLRSLRSLISLLRFPSRLSVGKLAMIASHFAFSTALAAFAAASIAFSFALAFSASIFAFSSAFARSMSSHCWTVLIPSCPSFSSSASFVWLSSCTTGGAGTFLCASHVSDRDRSGETKKASIEFESRSS